VENEELREKGGGIRAVCGAKGELKTLKEYFVGNKKRQQAGGGFRKGTI